MNWKVIPLLFVITGCQDIFTTNHLTALKQDPSSLSDEALLASAKSGDEEAIEVLEEKRVTLEEVQNNSELQEQFVDETSFLADAKIDKANFVGAIDDLINATDEEGGAEAVLDEILADKARVEDFQAGADYIVELYEVAPEKVTDTQKIAGSVGLLSEIVSDEGKLEDLTALPDREPQTLIDSGNFTEEEIENITKADELLEGVDLTEFDIDINEFVFKGQGLEE